MIKNCGKKLVIIARSFHFKPTYTQPLAPINCNKLFQGVIPSTCSTIAHKIVKALAHFTIHTLSKFSLFTLIL